MVGSSSSSDKPFGITNIKTYISLTSDLEKLNYDAWRELFKAHCIGFGVLGHLDGTSLPAGPIDADWRKFDLIVKLWIYGTISQDILQMILKNTNARDVWLSLESLFQDNKEARAIKLDNDLRTITIGDLSITTYCQKIKAISDLLANIDSPVPEKTLVTYLLNGLSDKYKNIAMLLHHRSPLPTFLQAHSMLLLEEQRLAGIWTLEQLHTSPTVFCYFPWPYGVPPSPAWPLRTSTLPEAFNACSLNDPADDSWYMDTGATSYLASDASKLSSVLNKNLYSSVIVGNGSPIWVTQSGHSTLPNFHRPLHLNIVPLLYTRGLQLSDMY